MVELVRLLASGPSDLQRRPWSALDIAGRCEGGLLAALGDPHRWQPPYTEAQIDAALRHVKSCSYLENIVRDVVCCPLSSLDLTHETLRIPSFGPCRLRPRTAPCALWPRALGAAWARAIGSCTTATARSVVARNAPTRGAQLTEGAYWDGACCSWRMWPRRRLRVTGTPSRWTWRRWSEPTCCSCTTSLLRRTGRPHRCSTSSARILVRRPRMHWRPWGCGSRALTFTHVRCPVSGAQ